MPDLFRYTYLSLPYLCKSQIDKKYFWLVQFYPFTISMKPKCTFIMRIRDEKRVYVIHNTNSTYMYIIYILIYGLCCIFLCRWINIPRKSLFTIIKKPSINFRVFFFYFARLLFMYQQFCCCCCWVDVFIISRLFIRQFYFSPNFSRYIHTHKHTTSHGW